MQMFHYLEVAVAIILNGYIFVVIELILAVHCCEANKCFSGNNILSSCKWGPFQSAREKPFSITYTLNTLVHACFSVFTFHSAL